jgi:hypothetical protein
LEAPVSGDMEIRANMPFIGKFTVKAAASWVRQKGAVYTIGIRFIEIDKAVSAKIQAMADDFNDCDTRILLKLPEVCVQTCKSRDVCNKIQKNPVFS